MRSDERIFARNGTRQSPHLSDDQLMETYVLAGENRHLTDCRQCRVRFDDLVHALDQVRDDAIGEADTVFDAERLNDQRDRINRRLERHGHPAEVVMFPHRAASHPPAQRVVGPVRRWVAAAAAAGLAAGMFLGFAMDRRTHYTSVDVPRQPSSSSAAAAAWQTAADATNEQFFSEIDAALISSRAREMRIELGAIDLMTTPAEIQEASVGIR